MSSQEIVKIIEAELKRKNISKAQFYNDVGIKAGHMSNWRKGSNYPSVGNERRAPAKADALTLFCRLQSICTHECEEPNATV